MPAPKNIQDMLGQTEEDQSALQTGMGLDGSEENPLEAMDKISKAGKKKKEAKGEKLDEDTIVNMMMTGDNSEGMFVPEEEKEDKDGVETHNEIDESAKVSAKGKATPEGKYKSQFQDDMIKHPDQYMINTPDGEMTVAEAMRKGYNPLTKRFDKKRSFDDIKARNMTGLNDADKESVNRLLDPASAQVAPADADKYGLKPDSPMIRQEQPMPGMPPQVGMPMPAGGPVGAPAPGPAMESQAPGGMDLSALLGGGQ